MDITHYHQSTEGFNIQEMRDEELFLHVLKWHQSGVRFLKAGYFVDAIHSFLEGFQPLESLLGQYEITLTQHVDGDKANTPLHLQQQQLEVHPIQTPLDDAFGNREDEGRTRRLRGCPCPYHFNLLVIMIYNLALAFHLHANQLDDRETYLSILRQSRNLYSQAGRLHATYGSDVLNLSFLENNLLHLHHILDLEIHGPGKSPVLLHKHKTSPPSLNLAAHTAT